MFATAGVVFATAVIATAVVPEPWCGRPFAPNAPSGSDAALSLNGTPGLFEIASALSPRPGSVALSYHNARLDLSNRDMRPQGNGFVAFEFLPRLTLSARGSASGPPGLQSEDPIMRDIAVNAQFLALREGALRPAIAIGATDFGGAAPHFESRYLVATKTLAGRVRATVGYGASGHILSGAFGGVAFGVCDWFTLIGEHDGRQSNYGVRVTPFPALAARLNVMPSFDVISRGTTGTVTNVTVRLGMPRTPTPRRDTGTARPARVERPRGLNEIGDALVALGLENVSVVVAGTDVVEVGYENRVWAYEEAQALGAVLGAIEALVPREIQRARVIIRKHDAPVLSVTVSLARFTDFLDGKSDAKQFAGATLLEAGMASAEHSPLPKAQWRNRARWRLDLTARPRVESTLLTELGIADSRISVLPEATFRLGNGVMITARKSAEIYRSSGFPVWLRDPNGDRLLLQLARPVGGQRLPGGSSGFAQLSVGRLEHYNVGAVLETDVTLPGGRVSLAGTGALFGASTSHLNRSMLHGTVRVRHPGSATVYSLTVGEFLYSDIGGLVEVARWFGPAEVGFGLRATEHSQAAGVRLSIPLGGARLSRPGRVRVHVPEAVEISQQTTILEESNVIRADIGILLRSGNELLGVVRMRDRLTAAHLAAQAELIRASALRWTRIDR